LSLDALRAAQERGATDVPVLHRTRDLLIRQLTMLANALRAHLAEFGIIEKLGEAGLDALILRTETDDVGGVPEIAQEGLLLLAGQIRAARGSRDRNRPQQ
jgi:transposase